jgi:hypothetical protein
MKAKMTDEINLPEDTAVDKALAPHVEVLALAAKELVTSIKLAVVNELLSAQHFEAAALMANSTAIADTFNARTNFIKEKIYEIKRDVEHAVSIPTLPAK